MRAPLGKIVASLAKSAQCRAQNRSVASAAAKLAASSTFITKPKGAIFDGDLWRRSCEKAVRPKIAKLRCRASTNCRSGIRCNRAAVRWLSGRASTERLASRSWNAAYQLGCRVPPTSSNRINSGSEKAPSRHSRRAFGRSASFGPTKMPPSGTPRSLRGL